MQILWWSLSVLMVLVGLAGSFLPLLPGPPLIFAGALLHHLALSGQSGIGLWSVAGIAFLTALCLLVDVVSGSLGAKWFGASRWGGLGGLAGAVVGLFFGLPGVLLGPVLGAFAGELLAGRGILPAGKSTWGTLLGTTAGILIRGTLAVIMSAWFFGAVLLGQR
ncbi:MAG: hypothetical protein RLZZ253_2694 [Verrucomicrobiota bacterium]|jgi:uncharacterized protein YqgC (DUF456 family)